MRVIYFMNSRSAKDRFYNYTAGIGLFRFRIITECGILSGTVLVYSLKTQKGTTMQLHLTFSARHVRLPLSHRYALQGMLYHALASNPHYSNYVHNSGYSCGARNYKLFTFGRLSGPFMHSDREIIFKDTVHFEVRSVDPNFVYQLGSVLCPSSQINLFENTLEILDSRIEDYSPNTCCAKISMLSPITVFETERSGYRRFIAPDESLFYTAVVNNALRKWQSYFNTPAPTDFSFEPALPTSELIQNHRIVSRFKRSTIVSYGGSYVLRGNGKLINFLYDAGLGSKNSQGLGMFNIESFPDL